MKLWAGFCASWTCFLWRAACSRACWYSKSERDLVLVFRRLARLVISGEKEWTLLGSTSRCLAASRRFAASLNRCSNRVAPAGWAPRDGRLLMLGEKVRSLSLAAASCSRFWRALMPCLYRRSKRDPSAWWQQQAGTDVHR